MLVKGATGYQPPDLSSTVYVSFITCCVYCAIWFMRQRTHIILVHPGFDLNTIQWLTSNVWLKFDLGANDFLDITIASSKKVWYNWKVGFYSLMPKDNIRHHRIWLLLHMGCLLCSAKPLPEPVWIVVNGTLRNKLKLNLNENTVIFNQEYELENCVYEMWAILFSPQCIFNLWIVCSKID